MNIWINIAKWRQAVVDGRMECVGRYAFATESEAIADQPRLRQTIIMLDADSPLGVDEGTIEIKAKQLELLTETELVPMCESLEKYGRCNA